MTEPLTWSVAGLDRGGAHLISQVDGRPAYGGTPSDETVRQAIQILMLALGAAGVIGGAVGAIAVNHNNAVASSAAESAPAVAAAPAPAPAPGLAPGLPQGTR